MLLIVPELDVEFMQIEVFMATTHDRMILSVRLCNVISLLVFD